MRKYAIVLYLLLIALPAGAQEQTLTLFTPVSGSVESGGSQSWIFNATEGNVLSFVVGASGDFDPQITITNRAGAVIVANDDYNYPANRDALLEAVTIPRTDSYTATISGTGNTSGDFTLTMLPGYGQVSTSDNFGGTGNWQAASDAAQAAVENGGLSLSLDQSQETGIATNPSMTIPEIYYAEVSVSVGASHQTWVVGMTARQTDSRYYLLTINERGAWRFTVRDGGSERVIRDWIPHPAIAAGEKTFTLAMLVNGTNFDFFYNSNLIGRLTDPTIPEGGLLGLAVQSGTLPNTTMSASFDNLTVTTPALVNGAPVLPSQVIVGTPAGMVQELLRRNVIPSGGEMALSVAESFAESARPGVERFMLGRGTTYQSFVMGTSFTWEAGAAGMTGCGIVFNQTSDSDYVLAYADRTGGYGLSQRRGDSFEPGIFAEKPIGNKTSYQLMVVALEDQVHYYVDGVYAGTLNLPAVDGAVGNAVVNFEPITTSCQFRDTWVWRWG